MPYSYIDADSIVTVTVHLIWMVKQFLHNMLANTYELKRILLLRMHCM
jgi:hypothetical protein